MKLISEKIRRVYTLIPLYPVVYTKISYDVYTHAYHNTANQNFILLKDLSSFIHSGEDLVS